MAATIIQSFAGQVDVRSNLTVNTDTLHVDSVAGRVGIGKTDPAYEIDVDGTVNATNVYVGDTINATNVYVGDTINATNVYVGSNLTVNTDTLHVDSVTGRLGIGTNTPAYTLDIIGDINLSGKLYQGASSTSLWSDGVSSLYYRSNVEVGTANLFVDTTTGNTGIGTTTPSYPLHVIGNIYGTGNITAYSDKRAKSDIVKIENALDKIDQLNGYTYTMNDERYTGLIAQEVLPVLPEAVVGSEETSYAIAYGNMMGLVIEAIKELRKRTETQ